MGYCNLVLEKYNNKTLENNESYNEYNATVDTIKKQLAFYYSISWCVSTDYLVGKY